MNFDTLESLVVEEGVKDKRLTIENESPSFTRSDIVNSLNDVNKAFSIHDGGDSATVRRLMRKLNWVSNKTIRHFRGKEFSMHKLVDYIIKLVNTYEMKVNGNEGGLADEVASSEAQFVANLLLPQTESFPNGKGVVSYMDDKVSEGDNIHMDFESKMNIMYDMVDAEVAISKTLNDGPLSFSEIKTHPTVTGEDLDSGVLKATLKMMVRGSNPKLIKNDDGIFAMNPDYVNEYDIVKADVPPTLPEYSDDELDTVADDIGGSDSDVGSVNGMEDEENLAFDAPQSGESKKPRWYPSSDSEDDEQLKVAEKKPKWYDE